MAVGVASAWSESRHITAGGGRSETSDKARVRGDEGKKKAARKRMISLFSLVSPLVTHGIKHNLSHTLDGPNGMKFDLCLKLTRVSKQNKIACYSCHASSVAILLEKWMQEEHVTTMLKTGHCYIKYCTKCICIRFLGLNCGRQGHFFPDHSIKIVPIGQ